MLKTIILSLAAAVLLMSNVYVGRAQLELAWENTNYHYQYFNRYKKIITAEEGLVDMKTGKIIYKTDTLGFFLSTDGSRLFTFDAIGLSDSIICTIYDFDTFNKLDSFKYLWQLAKFSLEGVTMDNNIAYFDDQKGAVIFWDIKTKKILDTIQYKTPVFNVITSPSNYEFTHDGRYMAFQYHTTSDQGHSGEYFVILDLLTSERVYAKYIGNGISYEFMNDKNIMLYPEKIHDSIKKVDNYFLQYYDLDSRKISKSIQMNSKTSGIVLNEKNTQAILNCEEGIKFMDLKNDKISNYIYNPSYKYFYLIWADDSLLYVRNAAFKIDWTVGVDVQSNEIEEIVVFPNPSGSFINLKLHDRINPKRWEIIDMRGNVLLKNINSISNDLKIDITQLAPETYILRIYTDKTVMNFKIIRQID